MLNSFLLFPQFIVLVHSGVDALQHETLDDFHAQVECRLQLAHVFLGVVSQYPVHLSSTGIIVSDAHTQTGIVLSDELLDVSQSVVSAVASASFQSERAQWQGKFIADDEQSLLVYFLLLQPVAHSVSAEVHKRGGLEQEHLSSLDACLGNKAVTLILKMNIGRFSKSVQYHKSCVVPGAGVFIARVTKPTNQIFIQCLIMLYSGS